MPNDVTVDLGNAYIGSAYSPQVAITETETGHEIDFTFADSEHPGQLKTEGFEVPNYASEEAEREAAEAARAAAESARAAAEQARTAAESARASAETGRATAESDREDSEAARVSAEQARAAAETARAGAEASRASAEQARTSAESARASAEAGRATAESARVSAEQARATAESARAAAESARVTAEQARQTNTAAAIQRADEATAAANTATTNADAATTAAQAATGEAEDATDAANAAAALATAAAETVTDAYFPDLTAGAAEGITGGGPTDTAAWTYRACPGTDGPATIESIHGQTVVWNQMAQTWTGTIRGVTFTGTDGLQTVSGTATDNATSRITTTTVTIGHKYLVKLGGLRFGSGNTATPRAVRDYNAAGNFTAEENARIIDTSNSVWVEGNVLGIQVVANTGAVADTSFYPQIFDLTAMFGAGNEPSTVAEFEALYPLPYYEYDAGSLLSVQMGGIETVGFNQWDEQWESGLFDANGTPAANAQYIRSKNFIPVFPSTQYSATKPTAPTFYVCYYDASETFITRVYGGAGSTAYTFETPSNARYVKFATGGSTTPVTTYNHDICINLSWSGYRNGEYEPYWKSERSIPAATYFPNGMHGVGPYCDKLYSDHAETVMYAVTLDGTQPKAGWSMTTGTSGQIYITYAGDGVYPLPVDASYSGRICDRFPIANAYTETYDCAWAYVSGANTVFRFQKSGLETVDDWWDWFALNPTTIVYPLATPTATPIDPPLNLSYRVSDFGTERIVHTDPTAAPTLVVTYGSTADGIRDRALACIAHIENGKASANYGVGSYLVHGGQLCRVTTAIAAGEAITIGTNVTATTVMAEVIALIAQ